MTLTQTYKSSTLVGMSKHLSKGVKDVKIRLMDVLYKDTFTDT